MSRFLLTFKLLACALMIFSCSQSIEVAAGAGVETENGFAGVIKRDNEPVDGVIVTLVPIDFNPVLDVVVDSMRDTTNSKGEYILKAQAHQIYNLQAFNPSDNNQSLIQNIQLPAKEDTIFSISETILKESGAITVPIVNLKINTGESIYIPGTQIFSEITAVDVDNGFITIQSIPAATITNIKHQNLNGVSSENLLTDSIIVLSADTLKFGPYFNWKHSQKIIINTSQTGANVSNTVENFPVLIRLDESNFKFLDAQVNGEDIRFEDVKGSAISYEIEQWNSVTQVAAIWVKVDTIYGNNGDQYITMFWGMAEVTSQSEGNKVFATGNGYVGVWHLSDNFNDATGNENPAINNGSISAPGIMGSSQNLDGSNDYLQINNIDLPTGDFTYSVWTNLDSVNDETLLMSSNGTGNGSGSENEFGLYPKPYNEIQVNSAVVYNGSINLTSGVWNYLTVTRWGNTLSLYVNGVLDGTATAPGLLDFAGCPLLMGVDVDVGCTGGLTNWLDGRIDEPRVSSTGRTADWVKLCYENQKAQSSMVIFEHKD